MNEPFDTPDFMRLVSVDVKDKRRDTAGLGEPSAFVVLERSVEVKFHFPVDEALYVGLMVRDRQFRYNDGRVSFTWGMGEVSSEWIPDEKDTAQRKLVGVVDAHAIGKLETVTIAP